MAGKDILKPRSSFFRVRCNQCSNEQIVFEKPASDVKCRVCGKLIVKSTGGKGKFFAEILEVYS
ncbi:MAG: 30S ribosomal protein S27e [Candidatus Brockarchaeota archaeon]|nr:30S ribosomal protein S27e [Candidatus Brockarchaeota archaeon]